MRSLRESDLECRLREREPPVFLELRTLHSLDESAEERKRLSDLEGRLHDLIEDVAAVGDPPHRKLRHGDDEAVGAHRPEKAHAQLIRGGPIVGVEEQDFR